MHVSRQSTHSTLTGRSRSGTGPGSSLRVACRRRNSYHPPMGFFIQPTTAPAARPPRQSRPAPVDNFRETAKIEVPEFFTVNSGRRFYSPELGRCINRDPLSEIYPRSEYRFVNNAAVNHWDYLGLMTEAGCQRSADRFMQNPGRYSPALERVLRAINRIKGCRPYPPRCECCTGDMADSWGYRDSERKLVVICANNMDEDECSNSTQKILETLVHENIHRLQECRRQEEQSCDGAVCTEIQAALNDGTCQRLSPGNAKQLVILSAAASAQSRCGGDLERARQRAEALYERCNVPIEKVPTL